MQSIYLRTSTQGECAEGERVEMQKDADTILT